MAAVSYRPGVQTKTKREALTQYVPGAALVAAIVLTHVLQIVSRQAYFGLFVIAILFSALYGTVRAGIVTAGCSLVAFAYLAPPVSSFWIYPEHRLSFYALLGGSCLVLAPVWAYRVGETRRSQFMHRAKTALTSRYFEPEAVAAAPVGSFADWCTIDELQDDGELERRAGSHVDIGLQSALWRSPRYRVQDSGVPEPIAQAVRTQNTTRFSCRGGEQFWDSVPCGSCVAIPLVVMEETIGVMTFGSSRRGRYSLSSDVELATEVAHHLALMLYIARQDRALQEARQGTA